MEVRVGKIDVSHGFKVIRIRPYSSGRVTWMDHIEFYDMHRIEFADKDWMTEEEFTSLGHFLEERVQNFHRKEVIGGIC